MIELQRKLIGDNVRNDAFYRALTAVVKPGMHVLDLGSGTGFLGFLASRMGAKVTCVEVGDILAVSKDLAKRNAIKNCTFIQKHSTAIRSLPPVDVLVSETLGNYALEENIIESIEDAKRFLKPGATIIPGVVRQCVCPVVSDRLQRDIDVWSAGYDLNFSEAREISLNNIYVKTIKQDDLLAEKKAIQQFDEVNFSTKNQSVRKREVSWTTPKEATVYGYGLWWEAELVPGITLSTSPLELLTHWEQIYLPLLQPVSMKSGDVLTLTLHSDTRWQTKINLRWQTTQIRGGKEVASQMLDMKRGYLA